MLCFPWSEKMVFSKFLLKREKHFCFSTSIYCAVSNFFSRKINWANLLFCQWMILLWLLNKNVFWDKLRPFFVIDLHTCLFIIFPYFALNSVHICVLSADRTERTYVCVRARVIVSRMWRWVNKISSFWLTEWLLDLREREREMMMMFEFDAWLSTQLWQLLSYYLYF